LPAIPPPIVKVVALPSSTTVTTEIIVGFVFIHLPLCLKNILLIKNNYAYAGLVRHSQPALPPPIVKVVALPSSTTVTAEIIVGFVFIRLPLCLKNI